MLMSDLNASRDALAALYGGVGIARLRQIYGTSFALDFPEDAALGAVMADLDDVSLSFLARDHAAGRLAARLGMAA